MERAPPHVAFLAVTGTHYEVGFQVGKSFQDLTRDYYARHQELVQYEAFRATEKGKGFCGALWRGVEQRFPHYLDELRGVADGAGIELNKVMLLSIERELQVRLGLLQGDDHHPKGCSDVLVNTGNQVLIGHNEDWDAVMVGKDCIVKAHIKAFVSEDGREFPEEKFVAHTWPGLPMGLASGFNHHGIAYSIDHLYPKSTKAVNKTADLFLTRHLLSATSLDHAKEILLDRGYGAAIGFCANIGMVGEDKLLSIEVGINEEEPVSAFSCEEITKGKVTAHFNNFERLDVESHIRKHCIGRAERFSKLPQPSDIPTLASVIGDYGCEDASGNIYQSPEAGYPWATVATVIYDVKGKRMLFYRGSSKDHSPILTLPFDILQAV